MVKINDKLSFIADGKTQYVHCTMYDRFGNQIKVDYHGYIFGLIGMQKFKKNNNEHSLILLTGLPGSGKSTFVEGIAALDSAFMGEQLSMDDIAWSMDNMIEKMDSTENINRPIWADEFIQGTGRFNQSNIGLKLKIGFVTKRLKKNTYFLVVDELREFPEKIVKMADAFINIKKIGFNRGYFDCWVDNGNIFHLWKQFKEYNCTWKSKFVRQVIPNCKGKFSDYRGTFLDVVEFDKRKMDETMQGNKENDKKQRLPIEAVKAWQMKQENPKLSNRKIAEELGFNHTTINTWLNKIKKSVDDV